MKKIKQVFPSRNYITIDSFGDVEVVFNPVGDGFEGDDKLMFRKGRWAFRVNDFLSGRVMPDGSKEGMGRKVYSLNLVYDDKDGEPIVNTTYVDPTSVIPLDGSIVDVVGSEKLAQEQTLQTVAKEETLKDIKLNTGGIYNIIPVFEKISKDVSKGSTSENQISIDMSINSVGAKVDNLPNKVDFSNLVSPVLSIGSGVDSISSDISYCKTISRNLISYNIPVPSVGKKYLRFVPGTLFTPHNSDIFYFCEGYCSAILLAPNDVILFGKIKKIDISNLTVSDLNIYKFKKDDGIQRIVCYTLS